MTDDFYAELAWLPRAPNDFRERCRALERSAEPAGREVAKLAGFALSEISLRKLAAAIAALRERDVSLAPLVPFKLGIVGNATIAHLAPAFVATAARHGVALECVLADYGQTLGEALDPASKINVARCDAVLLALDRRGLFSTPASLDAANAAAGVDEALSFVRDCRTGFRSNGGAATIVQTISSAPDSLFGSFDRMQPASPRALAIAFDAALAADLSDSGDVLLDVAALAETVGLGRWESPKQWNVAKFPFSASYLPFYADHVCRLIGAMRGRSRKCLVLDLDNTLWSGVIGDDGVDGIVVGEGDPTGEAHLDVQRAALTLRDRGIVLAVSSKNDDATARAAFEHPDMLLRENHIAVFQANWNDKATNIASIARELNLGLDAMVFLDDNPVERGLVRDMLPDVAVPELPDDPALFARSLLAAGYFESVAFSAEDRMRADHYRSDARRVALRERAGDLDAYLRSLEMTIDFRPFDSAGRSRIAQLVNKSNQFNLTTRRYTDAEVAACEADASLFTLQVRLADRFGDNGMICVVICRPSDDTWEIDTWLMSCRVLGRRVEWMTLREIVHHARARGIRRLVGRYVPTAKNAMVADHYEKLGFGLLDRAPSGETTWSLDTTVEREAATMTVERSGFALEPVRAT